MYDPITIVLADATDLLLIGGWAVLMRNPEFSVEAAVTQLDTLLTVTRHFKPQVIIFGERLSPEADVYQIIDQLHEITPSAHLIVLGEPSNGLYIHDLFQAGASGYLLRQDELQDCLESAVRTVLKKRKYLSPTANAEYLIAMQSPNANERLDPESRQVLQLLAHGEHAGQISVRLGIAKRRVYWVREKLRRRFGAKTNEHLIQRAAAEGFIYPRE